MTVSREDEALELISDRIKAYRKATLAGESKFEIIKECYIALDNVWEILEDYGYGGE